MFGGGGYKRKKNMGYGVVFEKTHWVWGLDEKKIIAGGGLHEKISLGGSEIVGVAPPMYFFME